MLKMYPAIIHIEDGYWVEWPDLEGCSTCGDSLEDTMQLAQEAMGLYIASLMEDRKEIPAPSDIQSIHSDDGIVTYITTNVSEYIRNTHAVKKTLSVPQWLSDFAEKNHLSLSKVLQDALIQKYLAG